MIEIKSILTNETESFLRSKSTWCDYLSSEELETLKKDSMYKRIYMHCLYDNDRDVMLGICLFTLGFRDGVYSDSPLEVRVGYIGVNPEGIALNTYKDIVNISGIDIPLDYCRDVNKESEGVTHV